MESRRGLHHYNASLSQDGASVIDDRGALMNEELPKSMKGADGQPVNASLDDRLRRHREISRRIQAG